MYNCGYLKFADDTQLRNSSTSSDFSHLIDNLASCTDDVMKWMKQNKLKLNADKTEAMVVGWRFRCSRFEDGHLMVDRNEIPFKPFVQNLGVYLDPGLKMDMQAGSLCCTLYLELWKIGIIRSYV